jgi:hypothetical protein
MSFPASVPPSRIIADYDAVRGSGSALPGGAADPGGG